MKKSVFKKSISLLTLSLLVSPLVTSFNVFANNNQPEVIISSDANDIPNNIVQQIIKENPDAGVINILEYGDCDSSDIEENEIINIPKKIVDLPANTYGGTQVLIQDIKTKKDSPVEKLAKDVFKLSVAKGETQTLTTEYTASLKSSFEGSYFETASIGADITMTVRHKRGSVFKGPEESSRYNTREYRTKFYHNVGRYTQLAFKNTYVNGRKVSSQLITKKGVYKIPTRYVSYSTDKLVR